MLKYATKFQMVMHARAATVVRLGTLDDFGLYASGGFRNEFGTSLMARGTKAEMEALKAA